MQKEKSKQASADYTKKKSIFGLLLGLFGIVYFFYIIFSHSSFLFKKFDPILAEKTYEQSQWVQSQNVAPDKVRDEWAIQNNYTGWSDYVKAINDNEKTKKKSDEILLDIEKKAVSDSFLYSYVGYKYVKGANPSLLNPEHPPFAKYLIGYSIKSFGSEHVIGVGIAFVCLLLVGVISFQIHGSLLFAGFALFLTSIFPLFTDQLIHGPQLELYQLFFFLLVVHMILMGNKKKAYMFYMGAGIFFGLLLSTKTLLPFLVLFSVWLCIGLWKKKKELLLLFLFGAITFCLTYFEYFIQGGTLRTFLGLQKYIVVFYGNAHIPPLEFAGNYLRLIFTGSWKFWDAARSISAYSEWNILWPLIFVIGTYKLKINWQKFKDSHLLIWFVILYSLFVFIVPIFPRYLLLLYIPLIALL